MADPVLRNVVIQLVQRKDVGTVYLHAHNYPDAEFHVNERGQVPPGIGRMIPWPLHGKPTIDRLICHLRGFKVYVLPACITGSLGYPRPGRNDGVVTIDCDMVRLPSCPIRLL